MISLMRRADSEYAQCNFTFPIAEYVEFEANPDIAGIGAGHTWLQLSLRTRKLIENIQVLLSFIITTCLAYVIVLTAYYFVQTSYNAGTITKLDHIVAMKAQQLVTTLAKPFPRRSPTIEKLARVSEAISDSNLVFKILLSFNDQQIITGFAILTVGLVQIDSISEYHFAIVQNLSVLSFVVHDTTAVILQDDIMQHRMTRTWRGITVISSMLITLGIQLPMGHYYWMDDYGVPVQCIWKSMKGNYRPLSVQFWMMIVWEAFLLYGLVQTLSAYFPGFFGGLMDNIVINSLWSWSMKALLAPRQAHRSRAGHPSTTVPATILTGLLKAATGIIFVITELCYSQAFGLQIRWMIMLNCINYIFTLRNEATRNGRLGDEDEWGFGQAVPMFLLILPIATVVETAYDAFKNRHGDLTRYHHPLHDQQLSTAPLFPSDMPSASDTTSYTVYWDNQADPSATTWISAVEVTSTKVTDMNLPLQPTGSGIRQTFSPHQAIETWTRVSLFSSGKKARFTGAGYYFGYNEFPNDGRDESWDMENELYLRRGFRFMMLCALVWTFGYMTYLALIL